MFKERWLEISIRKLRYIERHSHGGSPDHRQKIAREWRPKLIRCIAHIESRMEALVPDWRELWASWFGEKPTSPPVPLARFEKKTRSWRLCGLIVAVVEVYFAAVFASSWTILERWQAVALAESFAVLLSALTAVVLHAVFNDELPEDSIQAVKRIAGVLAGIAGVLIGAFYLTRFFPIGEPLFPYLTGSISIILPLVAGACFLVAHVYRDLNDPAYSYASLVAYREEVSLVLEGINEVLGLKADTAVPEAAGAEAPPITGEEPAVHRRIIAGLILLFALVQAAQAQVVTVRQWWDASGSLDSVQLEALRRGAWQAPMMRLDSLERVEIYTLGTMQDALGAPKATVQLAGLATLQPCDTQQTEAQRFLKIAQERRKNECERQKAADQRTRERDVQARLRQVSVTLSRLTFQGSATQSCIYQVIARCMADSSSIVNIIVTDGKQEACPAPAGPLRPLLGANAAGESRILVILLPGKHDGNNTYERMEARAREIKRLAPQVAIAPVYQAEQALQDLLRSR